MRRGFESDLQQYGRLAKDTLRSGTPKAEADEIKAALNWFVGDAARRQQTSPETQRHIYGLQKRKQIEMQRLHEAFRRLGTPEESTVWPNDARPVKLVSDAPVFDGQRLDLATLATDAEWGVTYALPKDAPVHLKKRYLLELAKIRLSRSLDEQIIADETASTRVDDSKKNAYRQIRKMDAAGRRLQEGGFIAEILVKNYLRKIALRFDFDFEVIPADVYEDVEHKIDFIIRRKRRLRGVTVEESKTVTRDVGIQFTVNKDPSVRLRKERQLRTVRSRIDEEELPIEDIMLVQMGIGSSRRLYEKWRQAGSPPGGPDDLWDQSVQKQVFEGIMKDLSHPKELEAQWDIFSKDPRTKEQARRRGAALARVKKSSDA